MTRAVSKGVGVLVQTPPPVGPIMLILTHNFNDNLRLKYPKPPPPPQTKNPEYGPAYDISIMVWEISVVLAILVRQPWRRMGGGLARLGWAEAPPHVEM